MWKLSSIAETYVEELESKKIAVSKRIPSGEQKQFSTSVQLSKPTVTTLGVPKIDIYNDINWTIEVVVNALN